MFFSHLVLSKQGPLGSIWLAAHWDRKLSRVHIIQTNIQSTVNSIISPQTPMALRMSSHLLLGVVRIYSFKAKFLLADCSSAMTKINNAFRPGVIDLPADGATAHHNAITLQDNFNEFDIDLPEINLEQGENQISVTVSRKEDITLREHPFQTLAIHDDRMEVDDGFGEDSGFLFGGDVSGLGSVNQSIEVERLRDNPDVSARFDPLALRADIAPNDSINKDANTSIKLPEQYGVEGQERAEGAGETEAVPMDADFGFGGGDYDFGQAPAIDIPDAPLQDSIRIDEPVTPVTKVTQQRRKRKLVIDEEVELTADELRRQCDDIFAHTREYDEFGPRTKRGLYCRELTEGGIESLFTMPTTAFGLGMSLDVSRAFASSIRTVLRPPTTRAAPASAKDKTTSTPAAHEPSALDDSRNDTLAPVDDYYGGDYDYPAGEETNKGAEVEMARGEEADGETAPAPIATEADDEGRDVIGGAALPEGADGEGHGEGEKGWSRRTQRMMQTLKREFEQDPRPLRFKSIVRTKDRKTAASSFFEVLVLKTKGYIDVEQQRPYEEILISPTERLVPASRS